MAGTGASVFLYLQMSRDLPKLDRLSSYRPYQSVEVEDRNGVVVWEFWKERRKLVPYEKIPKRVVNAFQAAEDSSFFEHGGIDLWAIFRAAVKNFLAGGVKQGASTITQQVAKTFLLTNERSLQRKVKEAILAYRIEKNFSKEEIMYLYLNQIFLGNNAYGIRAAAETYFHKEMDELSIAEAAMLAGLPKAPTSLNPVINFSGATERQRYVLQQMLDNRMITKDEYRAALEETVRVFPAPRFHSDRPHLSYAMEEVRLNLIQRMGGEENLFTSGVRVKTTIDETIQKAAYDALRRGIERADKLSGWRGPLRSIPNAADGIREAGEWNSFTEESPLPEPGRWYKAVILELGSLKRTAAKGAVPEKAVLLGLSPSVTGVLPLSAMDWAFKHVLEVGPSGGKIKDPAQALKKGDLVWVSRVEAEVTGLEFLKLPEGIPAPVVQLALEQEPEIQGGLVALDPFTGDIRAMQGGYSFEKSSFNRVTQALRQPGSSFKPLIYALAIENGYTSMTRVLDTAVVLPGARQEEHWMPKNHDDAFLGEITLRKALALSVNTIAVRMVLDEKVGVANAREFIRRLGLQSEMPKDFTLALGSAPVTLLEMARAFSIFPNGGHRVMDRLLVEAAVPGSEPVFKIPGRYIGRTGPDGEPPEDQIISPGAAYVMTSMLGAVITEGTGTRAASYGRPAGGKTGTSSDSRDTWFIGFNPKLVTAVWFGFDDNRTLGRHASGGLLAAPTWLDFMQSVAVEGEVDQFPVPDSIVFCRVNRRTGERLADPVLADWIAQGGKGFPPAEIRHQKKFTSDDIIVPFVAGTEPPEPEEGATSGATEGSGSLYEELELGAVEEPVAPEGSPVNENDIPKD